MTGKTERLRRCADFGLHMAGLLATLFLQPGSTEVRAEVMHGFLADHCLRCHGPEKQKADFRVDTQLSLQFTNTVVAGRWKEVLRAVDGHEMPPSKEPQPDAAEAAAFAEWITDALARAERVRHTGRVVLRRLNREEYNRTMRDLLKLTFDAGSRLPADPPSGGFDNIGQGLSFSPLHAELFHQAAMAALDQTLVRGSRPQRIRWRFDPEEGSEGMDRFRVSRGDQRSIILNGGRNRFTNGFTILRVDGWDRNVDFRNFRLPVEGDYAIRLRAAGRVPTRSEFVESVRPLLARARDSEIARNPRSRDWQESHFRDQLRHVETDRMYDFGPPRVKVTRHLAGQPQVIAELDIDAPVESPRDFVIVARFKPQDAGLTFEYAYQIPKVLENHAWQRDEGVARPELWIDSIEIEGPLQPSWPPAGHRAVISEKAEALADESDRAAQVFREFLPRAWRRPVTEAEVASKVALFGKVRGDSADFVEAIRIPLAAALSSPHFLYLVEPEAEPEPEPKPNPGGPGRPLDPWQLASRLSYFLWSTMPDERLFESARNGSLSEASRLEAEIDRMLADPRSDALVRNFAGQWLGLRQVGANPPSTDLYPHYDRHLELSIVGETDAFFGEILRNDLDVRNFLKSEFVTINERLARFYGIEGVRGDAFRRVRVPSSVHRGGLAGQASVLSITSNGTRTSPVKRGVWVMRTLLGQDPGLPVANVGEIAPKVPGIDKATVRQRLQIHREQPACARCHDRIDPLGFALENFDASGAWRDREGHGYKGRVERDDPPIDASARLPDGTPIDGFVGLGNALVAREELFLKALAERLYTYALGRELGFSDAATIREAVTTLRGDGRTLRALIHHIVRSEAFRNR